VPHCVAVLGVSSRAGPPAGVARRPARHGSAKFAPRRNTALPCEAPTRDFARSLFRATLDKPRRSPPLPEAETRERFWRPLTRVAGLREEPRGRNEPHN
jgi:hypothetical protein